MKKAAAALCIGGLALILFGCGSGGAGDDEDYYVSFTAGGTDYVLTKGYTDDNAFTDSPVGCKRSSGDEIYISASGEDVSDMGTQGPYLGIRIGALTPGTYQADGDPDEGSFGLTLDGTTSYFEVSNDGVFSLTLESFGDVGDAIKGTFSGTIKENGSSSGTPLTISNGYFYVKRLGEGAISAPSLFH